MRPDATRPYGGRPYDGGRPNDNGRPYGYGQPAMEPARPAYQKPRRKPVETAKKEETAKPPPGPLLIAVSIGSQRLTLYSGGNPIAHAPVSTGVPGHPTPTGIFSVIGKERFHRSNLYSNAPMPFMQRITWSGVALHQGVLPGYPASHGCIRLPGTFAQYLWGTTRMGARVIITRDVATPFEIASAKLFAPRPKAEPEAEAAAPSLLKIAESDDPVRSSDAPKPARVDADGHEPGAAGLKGRLDAPAPGRTSTRSAKKNAAGVELSDPVDTQPASPTAMDNTKMAGEPAESVDKRGRAADREFKDTPRMSDPVSVFISRKTGRLYVRQGFEPLFETTVTIRDPDVPLGTHLYTATDFNEDRSAMRWTAVTLSGRAAAIEQPSPRHVGKRKDREETERAADAPPTARLAALSALDRVDIPKDAVERISDLLSPGSSLIISDLPMSGETGKYTDFIILTH